MCLEDVMKQRHRPKKRAGGFGIPPRKGSFRAGIVVLSPQRKCPRIPGGMLILVVVVVFYRFQRPPRPICRPVPSWG
jgi:hypothetical protein